MSFVQQPITLTPSSRRFVIMALLFITVVINYLDRSNISITVSDIRVLENRQGQQWVALPSYAVSKGGKDYSYLPTIELTASLTRELTSRVLEAFEKWNAEGRR